MTSPTNYRVKIDLSRYHDDIRKFSCIYVNRKNISTIEHVKGHVKNIFGIREGFHLLLNGEEFLPPAEDVRVINDKDTIRVVPTTETDDSEGKCENSSAQGLENGVSNGSVMDVSKPNATLYHSMNEETTIEQMESSMDKMREDESMYASFNSLESSVRKRKRVRRKKLPKSKENSDCKTTNVHYQAAKKPHKSESSNSSAIHVRFNDSEVEEIDVMESETNSVDGNGKPSENGRNSGNCDLAALLAMKNCSTPRTYVNKKKKLENGQDSRAEDAGSPKTQGNDESQTSMTKKDKTIDEGTDYSKINPIDFPLIETQTQVNDVIAFKILRMGEEYMPEVSNYMIAKTLSYCPTKTMYKFEILNGQDEIKEPTGKFSLTQDDETATLTSNVVEYAFPQLLEPRLIQRK